MEKIYKFNDDKNFIYADYNYIQEMFSGDYNQN